MPVRCTSTPPRPSAFLLAVLAVFAFVALLAGPSVLPAAAAEQDPASSGAAEEASKATAAAQDPASSAEAPTPAPTQAPTPAPTVAPATTRPAATTEMPPIVAKAIDFHGGDVYRRSESALTLKSRSGASRIEARLDGPSFDYTVTAPTADGERRVRFTNRDGGNRVYELRQGEPVELSGEEAARAESWLMARVYFPFLPFRLADPGVYFTDLGLERWGERDLHKVKVTFEPGSSPDADDEYLYWFDPETGRLEQFAYSFHTGDGGLRLRRATAFERVGGILFSDQENLGVNGPGHTVDQITPTFAAERMEPVSTVDLEEIEVRSLGEG